MGRQTIVPGTDSDRHKDLDAQAAKYVEARDARMQLLAVEIEEKGELHELMNRYGLKEYRILDTTPNLLVIIEATDETVRVKKLNDPLEPKARKPRGGGKGKKKNGAPADVTVED